MKSKAEKLALLDAEVAFRNINNRALNNTGIGCVYSPTSNSPGCAIGRLIEDKTLCARLDQGDDTAVSCQSVFHMLPQDLQEYGQEFLTAVQQLHDDPECWDPNGLSMAGCERVATIRARVDVGAL